MDRKWICTLCRRLKKYDGDIAFKDVYVSIREVGEYEEWKEVCRKVEKESKIAHLLLASSFASTLNQMLGVLPFVVHIYGVEQGTGKTVGLMLAMSVWGNPEVGKLVRTLNATQVALAKDMQHSYTIFHLQEMNYKQLKSRWDRFWQPGNVYLTEGVDRGREYKAYGGIELFKKNGIAVSYLQEKNQ